MRDPFSAEAYDVLEHHVALQHAVLKEAALKVAGRRQSPTLVSASHVLEAIRRTHRSRLSRALGIAAGLFVGLSPSAHDYMTWLGYVSFGVGIACAIWYVTTD